MASDVLLSTAQSLAAEYGDGGDAYGLVDDVPFLMAPFGDGGAVVKFRMTEPHEAASEWCVPGNVDGDAAGVSCEMDGEYVWLWVHCVAALEASEFEQLIVDCCQWHEDVLCKATNGCVKCGGGDASLVHLPNTVAVICENCIETAVDRADAEYEAANPSNPLYALALPIVFVASAVGWAVFWIAYDVSLAFVGGKVPVPIVVVLAVLGGLGFGLGWPIGKLLLRSGLTKRFSPLVMAVGVGAVMVGIGELLIAGAYALLTGGSVLDHLLLQVAPDAWGYAATKLLFAVALIAALNYAGTPKQTNLRL